MERIRAGLAGTRGRLVAVGLAGVVVVSGIGIAAVVVNNRAPEAAVASPSPLPPSPSPSPSPSPRPSPSPLPSLEPSPDPTVLLGSDGRFTILLLGSDYRPAHPGNRTDVIMVASIDPTSGQTAVVSIPRDTARFPLPDGGVYTPKVNGLYQYYITKLGRQKAGEEIKRAVGNALGVEIDHYAFIGFTGVQQLVDAVGGVDVTLAKTVSDPYYWVSASRRGVTFPAGSNHLDGARALIFARTRKGDNDFERARRQQLLVAGAVRQVAAKGVSILPQLLTIGSRWVHTDLPLAKMVAIYEIAKTADLDTDQRVVFGPRTWATGIPGSTSFYLNLPVVRDKIDEWMPAVASPSPSASPSLSPNPSPSPAPS